MNYWGMSDDFDEMKARVVANWLESFDGMNARVVAGNWWSGHHIEDDCSTSV